MKTVMEHARRHVIGYIALAIALGGVSYAAVSLPRGSVDTKQLKRNAVTSPKVRAESLTGADIRTGSIGASELEAGLAAAGPQGPPGEQGPPGPSTGPAGGDLAGSYPDPTLRAGAVGADELGTPLAVRVTGDGAAPQITVASGGSLTPIAFDQQTYDTGNLWSPTEADRLTIPRTGLWQLSASVKWASVAAAGSRRIVISTPFSSGNNAHMIADSVNTVAASATHTQTLTTTVPLNAGDTVGLLAFQDTGSALTIELANTNATSPALSAVYLGAVP